MLIDARSQLILAPAHNLVVKNASQDLRIYLGQDRTPIYFTDSYGFTLLHWAAMYGHTHIVRILLEAGADINAACSRRRTALMWAASSTVSFEVCLLLIQEGADTTLVDQRGETALTRALSVAPVCESTVRLLLSTSSERHRYDSPSLPSVFAYTLLIQQGTAMDITGSNGMCPITYAIMGNNHPALELLVKCRTRLNSTIFLNHEMLIGLVACCADVDTMRILQEACISGPPLEPATIEAYWKAFGSRERYCIGVRDSVDNEKTAFQALLNSIVPANKGQPPGPKVAMPQIPGAFPSNDGYDGE
jgi:hypothetical protein